MTRRFENSFWCCWFWPGWVCRIANAFQRLGDNAHFYAGPERLEMSLVMPKKQGALQCSRLADAVEKGLVIFGEQ